MSLPFAKDFPTGTTDCHTGGGHGHGPINFSDSGSPMTRDTSIPKAAQAHSSN